MTKMKAVTRKFMYAVISFFDSFIQIKLTVERKNKPKIVKEYSSPKFNVPAWTNDREMNKRF